MNDPPGPVTRLREELSALDRAYSAGHHGLWSARRRSDLLDAALTELFGRSDPPPGLALAAMGGYGRREQLPHSDVDILLAHDGEHPELVAAFAERFLYPLWDAGFEVGHATRTTAEAVEAATERLDVATAMLDARPLAGEERLLDELLDAVHGTVAADPAAFAARLRAGAHERHERFGSAAHLLEPEVKEGAGGLRDVATVGWLERLAARELLLPGEREALEAAHEFLTRVRSALHLETGRRTDRLVSEHQPSIAREMGFGDEPRLPAVDGLMRALFEHARQVAYLTQAAFDRLDAAERGGWPPSRSRRSAAEVLDLAARAAEEGRPPNAGELAALAAVELPDPPAWDEAAREGLLRILRAGDAGVTALEALDRVDLLAQLLPEWAGVRCRPQRDPYHRLQKLPKRALGRVRFTDNAGHEPAAGPV